MSNGFGLSRGIVEVVMYLYHRPRGSGRHLKNRCMVREGTKRVNQYSPSATLGHISFPSSQSFSFLTSLSLSSLGRRAWLLRLVAVAGRCSWPLWPVVVATLTLQLVRQLISATRKRKKEVRRTESAKLTASPMAPIALTTPSLLARVAAYMSSTRCLSTDATRRRGWG